MADARLRTLERRWRESGAGCDHARFLVERLRAGEVEPEQVLLAAHLGDAGAREALGLEGDPAAPGQRAWTTALGAWRGPVPARAALAAARLVLPVFDRGLNPDPRPRRALRAGEAQVVCPCAAHAQRAAAAAEQADALASDDAGTAVWAAVQATCATGDEALPLLESAVVSAGRVAGVVAVRAAVRDALVPWALGYEDPLTRRLGGASA
ncbi:MAG: hypothetical protein M9894_09005 [Planctomycetes bacterium]|nr:hypothetical protein [Planctomycetota bacterium]